MDRQVKHEDLSFFIPFFVLVWSVGCCLEERQIYENGVEIAQVDRRASCFDEVREFGLLQGFVKVAYSWIEVNDKVKH